MPEAGLLTGDRLEGFGLRTDSVKAFLRQRQPGPAPVSEATRTGLGVAGSLGYRAT